MKKLALLLVLAWCGVAAAQPRHMDETQIRRGTGEAPEILLLTFGEGVQIFEKFGHGALCLHYPTEGVPASVLTPPLQAFLKPIADATKIPMEQLPLVACVNYGVTNFSEGSAMIWHFLRTEQKFWADTESLISMVQFYSGRDALGHQLQEDRDIWVQKLPLDDAQAHQIEHAIYKSLEDVHGQTCVDHEAEGCYYYYDHFFNNCTTRLRDMIDDATHGKLAGDSKSVDYPLTFRQMGRRGLAELPPLIGLADFLAGRQLDDTPTLWQAMFHPDVLREEVRLNLGVEPQLIYQRKGPPFPQDGSTFRLVFLGLGLLFGLPFALAHWRRPGTKLEKAALAWATFWLVLWGLIIYTLVVISSIPGVRWNEAVFVMTPIDIVLPFLGAARLRKYARVRVGMLMAVSVLCAIGLFHQPLWVPIVCAFIPLAPIALDQRPLD
ncbi:MAG TPA: DUF4105 domain-containing protein, partial [Polyangia bacterium]